MTFWFDQLNYVSTTNYVSHAGTELETQLAALDAGWNAVAAQLESATGERKELEAIIDSCQHWFKEVDINLAIDVRNSTTAEILVEHISMVNNFSSNNKS